MSKAQYNYIGRNGQVLNYHAAPLSNNNAKLSDDTFIFSLLAVKSCPGAKKAGCNNKNSCYGLGGLLAQKASVYRREMLFEAVRSEQGRTQMAAEICRQLKHSRKVRFIRVHDTGDFFCREYAEMWAGVARKFPNLIFYAYTKSPEDIYAPVLNIPNFHLHLSTVKVGLNTLKNFGTPEYLTAMRNYLDTVGIGSFTCPADGCGVTCTECMKDQHGQIPLFIEHHPKNHAPAKTDTAAVAVLNSAAESLRNIAKTSATNHRIIRIQAVA